MARGKEMFLVWLFLLIMVVYFGGALYAQEDGPEACQQPEGSVDVWDYENERYAIYEYYAWPQWEWFEDGSFYVDLIGLETGDVYRLAFEEFRCKDEHLPRCVMCGCGAWRLGRMD